jgi:hypothetical protein
MADRKNQVIRDFCEDEYSRWLYSRSKYAKQLPMNILAQFMPSKSGIERDYNNSQLCAAFHLALMLEIDKNIGKATCFLYVYFSKARPKPIKTLAFELGISRDTANQWAHDAAESIYRLANINVKLNEMMKNNGFNV